MAAKMGLGEFHSPRSLWARHLWPDHDMSPLAFFLSPALLRCGDRKLKEISWSQQGEDEGGGAYLRSLSQAGVLSKTPN